MAQNSADWTTDTFRVALLALAKRKVPSHEAEDLVQQVLTEALASSHRPSHPSEVRKWIYGILRHKIADFHRAKKITRGSIPPDELPSPTAFSEEEQSLVRWAMRELPAGLDAQKTLDWLLREGEGETLEDIAESENVPAPQVRQRVSRLRRYFRERWLAQVAAATIIAIVVVWLVNRRQQPELAVTPAPEHQGPHHPNVIQLPAVPASAVDASTVSDSDATTDGAAISADVPNATMRPTRRRRSSTPSSIDFSATGS
jgi:RNA polymerase sigma factor (sigma-70 family)